MKKNLSIKHLRRQFVFLIASFFIASPLWAQAKEIVIDEKASESPKSAPKVTSINFRDETLEAVTKSISKLTGKSFIIKDDLGRKKITIISQEDVTIEEAYRAFLSALEMNDLTVVPVGKFLKVVPIQDATKMSLKTYSGDYAPTSDGYITRIYHYH